MRLRIIAILIVLLAVAVLVPVSNPAVEAQGNTVVMLFDHTKADRLPISWTLTNVATGVIVAAGSRPSTAYPSYWSFAAPMNRTYRLKFSGKPGDYCSNYTVYFDESHEYLHGSCSYW